MNMLFYLWEVDRGRNRKAKLPPNPSVTVEKKKNHLILAVEEDGTVLRFCQICQSEQQGKLGFASYLDEHNLAEFGGGAREISLGEMVWHLQWAKDVDPDEVLERFSLRDKNGTPLYADVEEWMADCVRSSSDDDRLRQCGRSRCAPLKEEVARIHALTEESTWEGCAYALVTSAVGVAKSRAELLISALRARKRLQSRRVWILDPSAHRMTMDYLDRVFRAQTNASVLVLMEEGNPKDGASVAGNLRRIGMMAERHRDSVLTLFAVHPRMRDELGQAQAAMDKLSVKVISGQLKEQSVKQTGQKCTRSEKAAQKKRHKAAVEICTDGAEQLEQLIGLEEVKKVVRQATDYGRAQKLYESRGFKPQKLGMHMVFSGSPGTAKTTVARLVAQIFREQGILSEGKLIEVGRSDLVGKYAGWTALQVKEKFEAAKGSVLFIDEAYSLLEDKEGMYGDEAINVMVQEMENNRRDMVVILAGYKEPMEQLLSRNPGLRSRITFDMDFRDYTEDELYQIFEYQLRESERSICPEDEPWVRQILREAMKDPEFGNGRFVRTMVERALLAQASRLMKRAPDQITDEEIRCLTREDFQVRTSKKPRPEKRVIGFAG